MNKFLRRKVITFFALVVVTLAASAYSDEDELSPDTLPDEIPTEQNFGLSDTTENTNRDINSSLSSTSDKPEAYEEDAELEKPITPLFPTEPQELSTETQTAQKKVEVEEDLSKPDPSFVPPAPTVQPRTTQKTATELPRPQVVAPKEPESLDPNIKIEAPKPAVTPKLALPKIPPRPNLVWSPDILKQMLADPSHLVPVDTYISRLAVPQTSPTRPNKGVSDFSIILSNNEFYPSKIVLKSGSSIRLLFTTTNRKPAALVIEKLNIQRWVASQAAENPKRDVDRAKYEVNRELNSNRVTEIELTPKPGVYSFHDVITGAAGEISVEEP